MDPVDRRNLGIGFIGNDLDGLKHFISFCKNRNLIILETPANEHR